MNNGLYMYNRPSLFSALKKIDFGKILNNTSKTIGVIKDIIPIYYEIKPIASNVKTMFKVFNIVNTKNDNTIKNNNNSINNKTTNTNISSNNENNNFNNPTFFI